MAASFPICWHCLDSAAERPGLVRRHAGRFHAAVTVLGLSLALLEPLSASAQEDAPQYGAEETGQAPPRTARRDGPAIEVRGPRVWQSGRPYELEVEVRPADPGDPPPIVRVTYDVEGLEPASRDTTGPDIGPDGYSLSYFRRVTPIAMPSFSDQELWVHVAGTAPVALSVWVIPPWSSALPTALAVVLAIMLRQVVVALFAALWFGTWLIFRLDPVDSLLRIVDNYALKAVADDGRASILVFTLLLGGMIGVISRTRGARVMAMQMQRRLHTRRRSQVATWFMGLIVFVDDYANALLVGTSMRPLFDRMKMSRAKLAFIVDATAAPVSSVALVSSWVGVELGYIEDQYRALGLAQDAYSVFLNSLVYRYYPFLILAFGLFIAMTGRDFGPMRLAEQAAASAVDEPAPKRQPKSGAVRVPRGSQRLAWLTGALPLGVLIGTTMLGLYFDGLGTLRAQAPDLGSGASLQAIFAHADATKALLWASLVGSIVALLTAAGTRMLSLADAMDAWIEGIKSMVLACVVLVLAWSLSRVCRDLHTADFFIQLVGSLRTPAFLPAAIFLTSALIAFSTGTSWGTMAIVFPVALPLMFEVSGGSEHYLLAVISAILAGAVWGDHCSPISDTTIMAATAAGCRPAEHVRTQLPYALIVGAVAVIFGELGVGLGFYPVWVAYVLSCVILFLVVRFVGKPNLLPEVDLEGNLAVTSPSDGPSSGHSGANSGASSSPGDHLDSPAADSKS